VYEQHHQQQASSSSYSHSQVQEVVRRGRADSVSSSESSVSSDSEERVGITALHYYDGASETSTTLSGPERPTRRVLGALPGTFVTEHRAAYEQFEVSRRAAAKQAERAKASGRFHDETEHRAKYTGERTERPPPATAVGGSIPVGGAFYGKTELQAATEGRTPEEARRVYEERRDAAARVQAGLRRAPGAGGFSGQTEHAAQYTGEKGERVRPRGVGGGEAVPGTRFAGLSETQVQYTGPQGERVQPVKPAQALESLRTPFAAVSEYKDQSAVGALPTERPAAAAPPRAHLRSGAAPFDAVSEAHDRYRGEYAPPSARVRPAAALAASGRRFHDETEHRAKYAGEQTERPPPATAVGGSIPVGGAFYGKTELQAATEGRTAEEARRVYEERRDAAARVQAGLRRAQAAGAFSAQTEHAAQYTGEKGERAQARKVQEEAVRARFVAESEHVAQFRETEMARKRARRRHHHGALRVKPEVIERSLQRSTRTHRHRHADGSYSYRNADGEYVHESGEARAVRSARIQEQEGGGEQEGGEEQVEGGEYETYEESKEERHEETFQHHASSFTERTTAAAARK
jgi:hypothetical protein